MVDRNAAIPQLHYPRCCYFLGAYILLALITSSLGIGMVHTGVTPIHSPLMRAHVMCGLFGAVGASIAAIRKYYRALITEATAYSSCQAITNRTDWNWGWVFYYLSRPIVGAVLGALAYTLTFVGVSILLLSA
jgi:glycerol uptake facilitator-like aquaporin